MGEYAKTDTSAGLDFLTGLYSGREAEEKIQKYLQKDSQSRFHLLMLHSWNVREFIGEYGMSFVMTMIENQAIILRKYFGSFGKDVILGRAQRDTFLIFFPWPNDREVEDQADFIYDRLTKNYTGRDRLLHLRVTLAVYHVQEGVKDVLSALYHTSAAIEYSRDSGDPVVVYKTFMKQNISKYEKVKAMDKLDEDNLANYNTEFISFAVNLLTNSKDLDSSMDMLLLRIGHYLRMDDVHISEFGANNTFHITNQWTREQGVAHKLLTGISMDKWDGFFSGFGDQGINKVTDVSRWPFSDRDRRYFEENKIGGFCDILLYSNEHPIGYLSCNRHEGMEQWDERTINTLVQLSRLMSAFVLLRIRRRNEKERIEYLSRDELTGAYLYKAFRRKVKKILSEYEDTKAYAITYSDITNFSQLNETFGYEEGDHVLREFARRILDRNEANVSVCRLEGDRFVVFSVRDKKSEIEERVREVNHNFGEYLTERYPRSDLHITSGIYFVDSPDLPLHTMVDAANHARKSAKKRYYDSLGIYTEALGVRRAQVQEIVGSVHDAISSGAIEAFLQPKFSMKERTVFGAEALVRWKKEDGTYRYPDQFIPVLEEAGFIVDVDMCVYERVLQTLSKWREQGRPLIPISVNFSRVHFRSRDAYKKIVQLAKKYEIKPRYIEIEITESVFNGDRVNLYYQMAKLREHGFKIDIDDFGTGYSSLNMLLFAPVDNVKVDKSFIDRYETKDEKEYINQIGNLILSAKKEIIFEGVETEEQVLLLTGYGYDSAQGYLFSKPVSIREFEKLLDENRVVAGGI